MRDYDKSYELDGIGGSAPEKSRDLEIGDRVAFFGMNGTVTIVDKDVWHGWPVTVKFDSGREVLFTLDGRMYDEQTSPCLEIIGKIRPMVKKWQWLYSTEPHRFDTTYHLTEKDARELYRGKQLTKIEASEIEEEA